MTAPTEAEARRQALEVLRGRAYQPDRSPKPFRGLLRTIGGWLRPVLEPIGRVLAPIWSSTAGKFAIALVVIGVSALLTLRISRRRAVRAIQRQRRLAGERTDDPVALEAAADAAERRGDLELALRLRFRAGLVRLAVAGRVDLTPATTVEAVRSTLRSRPFEPVSRDFEEVAYGGRRATGDDVARARASWPLVLAGEREP